MGDPSLNYCIEGNGPPLLLLHGFGISFNIWRSLRLLLCPHFTLVMVELPGIGRSPVRGQPYIEEAICGIEGARSLLGIERWNVLSYSSGTRIAEKYIQLHPACVERIVFLCPAQVSASKALGLNIFIQLDHHIPQFGNWILSGRRLKFLIDLLGFNLKKNNLSSDWFAEISSQPIAILKETLRSLPEGGGKPFYRPGDLPTLFVWGHEDLITGAPRSQSLQNHIIHATHSAPQTNPQQVAEAVLSFLLSMEGNTQKDYSH